MLERYGNQARISFLELGADRFGRFEFLKIRDQARNVHRAPRDTKCK